MPYVIVRKAKPIMYQCQETGNWICKGENQVAVQNSQRGAYTKWRNLVALAKLPVAEQRELILPKGAMMAPLAGR